jgi:hypothetical protein
MASERARWVRIFTGDVLRTSISDVAILARVRLAAWLMDRSSRDILGGEESCEAPLNKGALLQITGASRRPKQLEILGQFADSEGINITDCGDYVSIEWPKFVNYLPPANRGSGDRRADADADVDVDSDVDAPGSALKEGSTRSSESDSTRISRSENREPVREIPDYVPQILLEFDAELDQRELESLSLFAWATFNTTGAHAGGVGFRPFVSNNWPFEEPKDNWPDTGDSGEPIL